MSGKVESSRKRKRENGKFADDGAIEDARDVFRRHFEAQFEPLPEKNAVVPELEESEDHDEDTLDETDDEWTGLSDDESTAIQVVEHKDAGDELTSMSKAERRMLLVKTQHEYICPR